MISRFSFDACMHMLCLQAYNCSVELSWAPFLVRQHKIPESINATSNTTTKESETLQIDTIDELAQDWKQAHILVFNTGHWWTHPEPNKGYAAPFFSSFPLHYLFHLSFTNNI